MHINDLTDDCLLQIFQFLTVTERIRNERVCTQWRHLLPCAFIDMQKVDMADFMVKTYKIHFQADCIQFAPTTIGLLRRCGPFLREISFGKRWLKVPTSNPFLRPHSRPQFLPPFRSPKRLSTPSLNIVPS